MTKISSPIDTVVNVWTPEGLKYDLVPAGIRSRFLAFFLDTIFQGTFLTIVALVLTIWGTALFGSGMWLALLIVFAVQWFYAAAFEAFWDGATPGKKILGIQVVRINGAPVDFQAAFLRNLLRAADAFFFSFAIVLIVMIAAGNRRLGDLAAGTVVVYKPKASKRPQIAEFERTLVPQPPPVALSDDERRAILAYASRQNHFSRSRSKDLALVALDALSIAPGPDPQAQLLAIAAWVSGARASERQASP